MLSLQLLRSQGLGVRTSNGIALAISLAGSRTARPTACSMRLFANIASPRRGGSDGTQGKEDTSSVGQPSASAPTPEPSEDDVLRAKPSPSPSQVTHPRVRSAGKYGCPARRGAGESGGPAWCWATQCDCGLHCPCQPRPHRESARRHCSEVAARLNAAMRNEVKDEARPRQGRGSTIDRLRVRGEACRVHS